MIYQRPTIKNKKQYFKKTRTCQRMSQGNAKMVTLVYTLEPGAILKQTINQQSQTKVTVKTSKRVDTHKHRDTRTNTQTMYRKS